MLRDAIDHQRLMTASTDRVALALRSRDPREQSLASRLLESPRTFQVWESEHAGLMRAVASQRTRRIQDLALRRAALEMIQRKALFEFLRDQQVRGEDRQRVIGAFRPDRDYESAVVAEHAIYLRRACSFLCTEHVGESLVACGPEFAEPLRHYAERYAEYFSAHCHVRLLSPGVPQEAGAGSDSTAELLPLLRLQVVECRRAILQGGRELERHRREWGWRRPTGDTVRLRTPFT